VPITDYDAKFYEGSVVIDANGNVVAVNKGRLLSANDSIPKNSMLIIEATVTGYSPANSDTKTYYKIVLGSNANATENGQIIAIRPPIKVISVTQGKYYLLDTYDPKVNGESIEVTNYPMALPQGTPETDTYIFAVGPFTKADLFDYDVSTASATVIFYEGNESGPGPTPTSGEEKGGE